LTEAAGPVCAWTLKQKRQHDRSGNRASNPGDERVGLVHGVYIVNNRIFSQYSSHFFVRPTFCKDRGLHSACGFGESKAVAHHLNPSRHPIREAASGKKKAGSQFPESRYYRM